MIAGSVGTVVGRNRNTRMSGVTMNFSKFQRMFPALPRSSFAFVNSAYSGERPFPFTLTMSKMGKVIPHFVEQYSAMASLEESS